MSRPDPALELEALASVRAELDAGTDPLAIFDVLGIAREEFDGMEEILMASFAEDTDTGRTERIDRYKEIYDARRAAKESLRVGIPEVPDLLSPPESPADENPLDQTAPAVQLATFQLAPPTSLDPDATAQVDVASVLRALRDRGLPFHDSAPNAQPPAAASLTPDPSGETVMADVRAIREGAARAIPFAATDAPEETDQTAEIDVRVLASKLGLGGVPFAPPRDAAATAASDEPLPRIEVDPKERTDTGTAEVDRRSLHLPPIPFDSKSAGQRGFSVADQTDDTIPGTAQGALPILLERCALVVASMNRSQDQDQVLREHGFTPETWSLASREVAAACNAAPDLRARYDQLLEEASKHVR
ncbi:MAG: hypothetical protein IPG04_31630 [Polyangiaceae bacterium]|nr:hypothetical protein [Polyangiaceae bacterium]